MTEPTFERTYQTELDDTREVRLSWRSDGRYLIRAFKQGACAHMCLSAEAMAAIFDAYVLLLKYQASIAMDGIGAEL